MPASLQRPASVSTTALFPLLFARYVTGQIADAVWTQIMSVIDADGTTQQERTALTAWVYDALEDLGPQGLNLPKVDEVADLLGATRA
ncbi:hypothetical protein AWN76_014225 [Rhodothermaceae bacterium RA]|nr:hypothetical protein AWN76_014225 [Rhodothermaceae bacterium RA]